MFLAGFRRLVCSLRTPRPLATSNGPSKGVGVECVVAHLSASRGMAPKTARATRLPQPTAKPGHGSGRAHPFS